MIIIFFIIAFWVKQTKSYTLFSVPAEVKQIFQNAQTTDWVGRTVATLVLDENISEKAGRATWCYDVSIIPILYKYIHIFIY